MLTLCSFAKFVLPLHMKSTGTLAYLTHGVPTLKNVYYRPKTVNTQHTIRVGLLRDQLHLAARMFFSNRSVKQREDILTNKLAANGHVNVRKTQIAQCAAVDNWGDTWNIIRRG